MKKDSMMRTYWTLAFGCLAFTGCLGLDPSTESVEQGLVKEPAGLAKMTPCSKLPPGPHGVVIGQVIPTRPGEYVFSDGDTVVCEGTLEEAKAAGLNVRLSQSTWIESNPMPGVTSSPGDDDGSNPMPGHTRAVGGR